jgi:catechol 2,3-dioxygenase-like lactoylglutathione lyase family enzyme
MPSLSKLPMRLHHNAYVARDLAATRAFYEDVLGMPLVATWAEVGDFGDGPAEYCHAFFGLADGSALAFFQFDGDPEALRPHRQSAFVHVALAVDEATQDELAARLRTAGIEPAIIDHGYCRSLYVSDPDGLLLEFTLDPPEANEIATTRRARARDDLERWLGGDHTPNNDWRAEVH